jgi:ketosteroid isomerase-like protein
MEPELQRLLDEAAIREVAIRYCRAIDQCDWPALAAVFAPDATAWLGSDPVIAGLDGITRRVSGALDPLDGSQHIVGNQEVTVDGDEAAHQCYFQAQHVRRAAEGGLLYIVAGRYIDQLRRTGEGWRIVHRRLEVMWTEGNPAVLHKPT